MISKWILHMVSFTLLVRGGISNNQCPHYEVKPGKESPLMDSLQCHNDFSTYGHCSWEVDPHVHPQSAGNTSMFELYYWNSWRKETVCDSHRSSVLLPNGKILHECRYFTQRFGGSTNHTFYFKVPCKNTATTLKVAQYGKVKAPIDLTETPAKDGGHLLSWRSPYPASSNITRTLVYQLQYKYMHDWTTVNNINVSEYMIDKESLLPGYDYQARVRARGPVGLWSDWSPPVSWKTHNDVSGVFNLQCVIVGEQTVTCTWQMKTNHYQLMSYHLWCHDSDNVEPFACCKDPQLQSRDVELSEFMCSVNVSDPYMLTVELRPVLYSRIFRTCEHIKLSQPDQIQVIEKDNTFIINWTAPVLPKKLVDVIQYSTELQISTNEGGISKNITLREGLNYFEIASMKLNHSTNYQAQIRLVPISVEDSDYKFKVQPSDWSHPAAFTTKPVLSNTNFLLYILIPVFAVVLFVIFYNALPACHRRVKLWNGSVPSPIKSTVLEGLSKKSPTSWPQIIEKEATSICVLLATDNLSIRKSSVTSESLYLNTEDVSFKDFTVKMGQSCGSTHLCTYVEEGVCKDKSGMNFSGPYILCCEDSCTQDKVLNGSTDKDHTPVSECSAPINGGYVIKPPNAMPAAQKPAPVDSPTNNPSDEPPAYTPSPDQSCTVLPHPSGYFTMPCVAMIQSEPRGSSGT